MLQGRFPLIVELVVVTSELNATPPFPDPPRPVFPITFDIERTTGPNASIPPTPPVFPVTVVLFSVAMTGPENPQGGGIMARSPPGRASPDVFALIVLLFMVSVPGNQVLIPPTPLLFGDPALPVTTTRLSVRVPRFVLPHPSGCPARSCRGRS